MLDELKPLASPRGVPYLSLLKMFRADRIQHKLMARERPRANAIGGRPTNCIRSLGLVGDW
jgi:hypothetical protein